MTVAAIVLRRAKDGRWMRDGKRRPWVFVARSHHDDGRTWWLGLWAYALVLAIPR